MKVLDRYARRNGSWHLSLSGAAGLAKGTASRSLQRVMIGSQKNRHGLAGAVVGNRLHLVSGDVQSAGISGMHLVTDSHDVFEFGDR